MKKILILNWRDPKHPNAGGAEIATLEHAKYWVKKGNKVVWFTSNFGDNKLKEESIEGIQIIRRSNQTLGVHISAFFWYLLENKVKFDIVIDQFHGIPFFTPLYVRTKKIAYIHEVTKEVWRKNQLPKPLNIIPALLGEIVEKMIFKVFYQDIKFMTVSNSTKEDLISFGIKETNIKIINNGLHSIKQDTVDKEKKFTLLYLGALAKDKGTDGLIDLFIRLKSKNKDWQFWIAGKGSPEYVDILRKNKNIRYFGFVSENKKFELYKKSHLFINLSIREGWGLTNIEANSQGTPVVGFDVPGVRDSVKDGQTGLLANNGDFKDIERKIEDLFRNSTKYSNLSKNAYLWSSQFNWRESGRQSLSYLQEVLASKS